MIPFHPLRLPRRRRNILSLLLALLLLGIPAWVAAHPLGNFTVNHFSRIELAPEQVRVFHVLDMAEVPAFQERSQVIDQDRDGQVSAREEAAYLAEKGVALRELLHLTVNGERVPLAVESEALSFPEGQGGLLTLRLTMNLVAPLPESSAPHELHFENFNDTRRLGWREIIVQPQQGVDLLEASVPQEDVSQALQVYPEALMQSPLNVSEATLRFQPGSASSSVGTIAQAAAVGSGAGSEDGFAALIEQTEWGWSTLLLALIASFGWGAAHALTPGHGKTVVAAYLVGSRGTARHALFLGLTTTITHTAGVFALGFITLFLSRYILPEQLFPWLGVASGLIVVVIGLSMIHQRWQAFRHPHRHHHHPHHHDHEHSHAPPHDHEHDHGSGTHSHLPPGADGSPITWRDLLALGVSGGLIPCPSALVVLLSAIALQRVGLGLVLIVAFSVGLASVLTGIGIVLVHAQKLFHRLPGDGRVLRVIPIASALVITVLGVGITVQALLQNGTLQQIAMLGVTLP